MDYQKINYIMEALRMTEENTEGTRVFTIAGVQRTALIDELVSLLTINPEV